MSISTKAIFTGIIISGLFITTGWQVLAASHDELQEQYRGDNKQSDTVPTGGLQERPEFRGPESQWPDDKGTAGTGGLLTIDVKTGLINSDSMVGMAEELETAAEPEDGEESPGVKAGKVLKVQAQDQTNMEQQLDKLEERSGLARKLMGPDYKILGSLRQQMVKNQERIEEMVQVRNQIQQQVLAKNQVQNQAEDTQLETMLNTAISQMTEQNTALQQKITAEEGTPGLFGWFFKLLAQ